MASGFGGNFWMFVFSFYLWHCTSVSGPLLFSTHLQLSVLFIAMLMIYNFISTLDILLSSLAFLAYPCYARQKYFIHTIQNHKTNVSKVQKSTAPFILSLLIQMRKIYTNNPFKSPLLTDPNTNQN